jgi:hypothetical protein
MSKYQEVLSLQDRKTLVKQLKMTIPNAMPMVLNIDHTKNILSRIRINGTLPA